jgi:hypothetical protein
MKVSVNPAVPMFGARLNVEGKPELKHEVQVPSGEPNTPLGRPRLRQKFLSLAEPVYGKAYADKVAGRLLGLRDETSAPDLVRSLRLAD